MDYNVSETMLRDREMERWFSCIIQGSDVIARALISGRRRQDRPTGVKCGVKKTPRAIAGFGDGMGTGARECGSF